VIYLPQWITWLLILNFLLAGIAYFVLFPRKKVIGFHLGMNIAMVTAGCLALAAGIVLINLFPLNFKEVTIAAILVGVATGLLFGSLFDYQTVLTGTINGMMMGIMAPMVGAAASEGPFFILTVDVFITLSLLFITLSATRS
jgi:hypothetical protein